MNTTQINEAISQTKNIISMMTDEEKKWFARLDQEDQFKFMCAFLAATV